MDFKKIIEEKLPKLVEKTLVNSLGIELVSINEKEVIARMPVDERTCQSYGILSGGANLALAETIAGVGSVYHIDKDEQPCGIQVSANHMHMAPLGCCVEAVGSLVHKGRKTHVWNVDITSSQGKLITSARVVNMIIKRKL